MASSNGKTWLFKIGLILFPISVVVNAILIKQGIGGLVRELARLGILVGFFLLIFGGIYRLCQRSK